MSLSLGSIGGSREKTEDSSTKKVLTELLVQISSIHPQEQVTIVGATNRL
jgi:SpoVK/Ycf46/Vps4 family AAA+-type ATPase